MFSGVAQDKGKEVKKPQLLVFNAQTYHLWTENSI